MMSEMKCPKRRSQRKITFFINRDKQQTKNNFFNPFTCKPRIALEPQWLYICIELAEVGVTIKRRCPFPPQTFFSTDFSSARLEIFERGTFFGSVFKV